jgi:hypothetical protein
VTPPNPAAGRAGSGRPDRGRPVEAPARPGAVFDADQRAVPLIAFVGSFIASFVDFDPSFQIIFDPARVKACDKVHRSHRRKRWHYDLSLHLPSTLLPDGEFTVEDVAHLTPAGVAQAERRAECSSAA